MHIQLYISEDASEGHRFQALIRDAMPEVPVIQYHGIDAVGRVVPIAYDEKIIVLIMVANIEELELLARGRNIWERNKTILVLPENEPEIVNRGLALRPVYTAFAGGDFTDVLSVIDHIRSRLNGNDPTFSLQPGSGR